VVNWRSRLAQDAHGSLAHDLPVNDWQCHHPAQSDGRSLALQQ